MGGLWKTLSYPLPNTNLDATIGCDGKAALEVALNGDRP
jgi:hypothetical protein